MTKLCEIVVLMGAKSGPLTHASSVNIELSQFCINLLYFDLTVLLKKKILISLISTLITGMQKVYKRDFKTKKALEIYR